MPGSFQPVEEAMDTRNLWPTMNEALRALGAHYGPAMDKTAKQNGLEPTEHSVLLAALTFDPHPVAVWKLRVRGPYTAAGSYDQRLRTVARLGYLRVPHEGEYRLTDLGRRTVRQIVDSAYKALSKMKPMPAAELDRLAALLRRLVDASVSAPEPPDKWSLGLSRRLDPGDQAHVMVRIDQSLSDLEAYRDDSHLAAWRPNELSGAAWEALTYVWRDEARTLDELAQKLARRGHTREDYAQALADLSARGLVMENATRYQVTKRGQTLRQKAEDQTDRYFRAPWRVLAAAETDDLCTLLKRLDARLTVPAAASSGKKRVKVGAV
jgi:hypothetical protein